MIEAIRRICELQKHYSAENTPEMQERGHLIRNDLANGLRARSEQLSNALGHFGSDFHVDASDGIGRKTELPWVRFYSERMSPRPTEGFYCVLHFSTDGSAINIAVGCGASQFCNGSFIILPDSELDKRTAWARRVVQDGMGSINPFSDPPDYGARRPLPKSFERATAMAKRIPVDDLEAAELDRLLVCASEYLRLIYQAEADGRGLSSADQTELEIVRTVKPLSSRKGQGYGLSAADRKIVELQAMQLTKAWLEGEGYQVIDTSANHSYDYEAKKDGLTIKVEVKGTTSDNSDAIFMTRNEVELHRAEKGNTALFIAYGIRLKSKDGAREALGGELQVYIGWDIDKWQLTSMAYRVEKPKA